MPTCPFCNKENFQSRIIQEFEHGYWVIAENQYYEGYSIFISKEHFREWHDVPDDIVISMNQNIRLIAAMLEEKFQPRKINLAAFGNQVEHLHWHIVPRYLSDPEHLQAPNLGLPASLSRENFFRLKKTLSSTSSLALPLHI